jgi:hypothetical protein
MRSFVNREPAEEGVDRIGWRRERGAENSTINNLGYKVDLVRRRVIVGERVLLNCYSSSRMSKNRWK